MISGTLSRDDHQKESAVSRVQKVIVWLIVLKKRKRRWQIRNETRSFLALLLHSSQSAARKINFFALS